MQLPTVRTLETQVVLSLSTLEKKMGWASSIEANKKWAGSRSLQRREDWTWHAPGEFLEKLYKRSSPRQQWPMGAEHELGLA